MVPPRPITVGEAFEDWSGDARFLEYSQAVDPLATGHISSIPTTSFPPELHAPGGTRIVLLDLSGDLGTGYPATSPALLARFLVIEPGTQLTIDDNATSQLVYCIRGTGRSTLDDHEMEWSEGDVLVFPGGAAVTHAADTASALYSVTDGPLLEYLGVTPRGTRFAPTRYTRAQVAAALAEVVGATSAGEHNRTSVLFSNATFDQTLTVTHTLWAMFGVVPSGRTQRPHRHQSVTLDYVVDCSAGCHTLIGDRLDPETDEIIEPRRVEWEPGGAFVTPPGMWHSHHNPTDDDAYLLPIQDSGLHSYLRSLDIRFVGPR